MALLLASSSLWAADAEPSAERSGMELTSPGEISPAPSQAGGADSLLGTRYLRAFIPPKQLAGGWRQILRIESDEGAGDFMLMRHGAAALVLLALRARFVEGMSHEYTVSAELRVPLSTTTLHAARCRLPGADKATVIAVFDSLRAATASWAAHISAPTQIAVLGETELAALLCRERRRRVF